MRNTTNVGHLKLPFSHACQAGDLIFVSGQASVDLKTGDIIPGTLAQEMKRSMDNLRTIVEAAGAGWEDIIKVNCFVRRDSDLVEYNLLYREFFSEPFPTRTTLTNCLPESILFEIDCIAHLQSQD
jgi:2-iminobutanoate/2-iminopropanoate deaminase